MHSVRSTLLVRRRRSRVVDEMRTNPRDSFAQHTASSGPISPRKHTRYLGVNLQQMQARQPVHQLLRDSALMNDRGGPCKMVGYKLT